MILIADRRSLAQDIQIARDAGARLEQVCEIAGINARTLQRWHAHEGLTRGGRQAQRGAPHTQSCIECAGTRCAGERSQRGAILCRAACAHRAHAGR